ncbi:MAG TPA: hypothetical protein EYP61_01035 [Candidatus Latescibacteria bacterium]|nr:hypothetical protein [Candidatus Latescibacterota bacterium]
MKEVRLEATGVTSPANFGRDVKEEYARALLEAQKRVSGCSLTGLHRDVRRWRMGSSSSSPARNLR